MMRHTKLIFTLILGCAMGGVSVAQTDPKCDVKDKDCIKAEAVKADDVKSSVVSAKFKATEFVPYSGSLAIKPTKSDPIYRPEPTPTQEDQPAAAAKPASNGSNPVDLITRVEMKYQFQNFGFGSLHAVPVIRGDYAFTHTVSFRMDLPIMVFDSKTPGAKSESGIGDIVTSMTFVKVLSEKFVGAFVPRIDFPTASHASLGFGKYAFKPLIAGVTPLAPGLGFVGVLEYHVSFAGNRNRLDINELHIKPIILKSFLSGPLKGYYANPKLEVIVDFETDNHTTAQLGAEFGKALNKNVVVFAIPTFHVGGTKRESFKLEVGFRYLFR